MPFKKPGKITFKGKIDPRLIPTDSAPGYEIVDAKVTESAVEVWLSDGRAIITPLSWYPTLQSATPKQRRAFENLRAGLSWEELDLDLSAEGMLAGKREFQRPIERHKSFSSTTSPLMTYEEAANNLNISRVTINRLVREGKISSALIGGRRLLRIPDLAECMQIRNIPGGK